MLGITDYWAFVVAVLVFLALPGPGTLALLTATGKGGFRAGAAATLGLIVGDQVLLWLAALGVAAVLQGHPILFKALQYVGAAYLVFVGLRLILSRGSHSSTAADPRRSLLPPGVADHAAESEGHRLLHGILSAIHRSGDAAGRVTFAAMAAHDRSADAGVLPDAGRVRAVR